MSGLAGIQVVRDAQHFMEQAHLSGWLIHDYRHSNPVFHELVPAEGMITRPCFLWVPRGGKEATLLVHHVDAGKFNDSGIPTTVYRSRNELLAKLKALLPHSKPIAME